MSYPPNPPPNYGCDGGQGGYAQQQQYYGDSSGNQQESGTSGSKGLQGQLKHMGGFLGKHKMEAATAAFNYKFGGGLGKVLAAGQAAQLASGYSKEQGRHGGGGGGQDYDHERPRSASSGQHKGGGGGLVAQLTNVARSASHQMGLSSSSGPHAQHQQQQQYTPEPSYGASYGQPPPQCMSSLSTGAVVSLWSPASGTCLQVVQAAGGQLAIDALGHASQWNAHFTVLRLDERTVALSNYGNYVAIEPYAVRLYNNAMNAALPPACHLRVQPCNDGVSLSAGGVSAHCNPSGQLVIGTDAAAPPATWHVMNV